MEGLTGLIEKGSGKAQGLFMLPGMINTFATGFKQRKQAKRLKMRTDMPEAFKEEEGAARLAARDQTMPGQTQAENAIKASTASTIGAIKEAGTSSSNIIAGATAAQKNQQEAMGTLAIRGAEFNLSNRDRLTDVLRQKAGYEEQNRQEYNATKSALEGASRANFDQGFRDVGTYGMLMMGGGGSEGAGGGSKMSADQAEELMKRKQKFGGISSIKSGVGYK